MRGLRLALVVTVVALLLTDSAGAATVAQETLDRYFRIEYQVAQSATKPVLSGYIYNAHPGTPVERMQLAIEGLDAAGNVVGSSSTWVLGTVPPGNRAYFSTSVVPAASYRVQVLFFDWGSRGGSGN
jgi:hypothetical protein